VTNYRYSGQAIFRKVFPKFLTLTFAN
jgi:hypothetical protein